MLKPSIWISLLFALQVSAQEYSPVLNIQYADNLYWGDLHVHSNLSPDSFAFGNARLTTNDAMLFAKGHPVKANSGQVAQLSRPLDFLLVADHAEFIGVFPKLIANDRSFVETELGKRWRKLLDENGNLGPIVREWASLIQNPDYKQELSPEFRINVFRDAANSADKHNDPGVFTAFIGYEWTAMVEGNNLHRVVLFRDGPDIATQLAPFSALDSQNPEDLWTALSHYEQQTGGQVMSIPHNGNISNGLMFASETLDGKAFDRDYAQARIRWEPVYEVTQVKGDGESHPFLSPDDEFADFETWDEDNIGRTALKQNEMLKHEYARSALKLGLEMQDELGVNPYEFGLLGSTDSHTTLSTSDDNNFWGKFKDSEPTADRLSNRMGGRLWYNWKLAASGYAAVWAKENTREALFDAIKRKEIYATTGPRIALRVFAGWDFAAEDLHASDLASVGYEKGVPMGARLTKSSRVGNTNPKLLIQSLKDPDGANLDRVQVIKGWLNKKGEAVEKVYDVAVSEPARVDKKTGKVSAIVSTVNVADASYNNSVGAISLGAVWEDKAFNPAQRAFYYVRVIEIPTPRWSAYDARYFGRTAPNEIPMITQERVYSSPIWYNPD
ncbi:MAG: DUF3604 domain-containing protein [bacterium]|nr:DUF3604 domain-containing protein [Gammaproteobacteria bacterium]